jgi:hypothetical protein
MTDSECPGGICLTDAPGGYCSKLCSGGVSQADALCPSDAQCVAVNETASACFHPCSTLADCRRGYACAAAPGGSVCIPACTGNQDCGIGYGYEDTPTKEDLLRLGDANSVRGALIGIAQDPSQPTIRGLKAVSMLAFFPADSTAKALERAMEGSDLMRRDHVGRHR